MGLAREWVDIFIHTLRILKQHGVAQVRNHADIMQVFEFEGFFSAQIRGELIKAPIHAGFRQGGCSLSTKLSTKDVGTCDDR